jgi:hypothetical protein
MWWVMSQKILLLIALFAPMLLSAAGCDAPRPKRWTSESEEAGTGDGI